MQNRITYYLTLATTSAFAMFGVVSAFYSEVTSENWQVNGLVLAVDFLGVAVTAMLTIRYFMKARSLIQKDEAEQHVS